MGKPLRVKREDVHLTKLRCRIMNDELRIMNEEQSSHTSEFLLPTSAPKFCEVHGHTLGSKTFQYQEE